MSPEPFVSRAKALPPKRSEKSYADENDSTDCRKRGTAQRLREVSFKSKIETSHTLLNLVDHNTEWMHCSQTYWLSEESKAKGRCGPRWPKTCWEHARHSEVWLQLLVQNNPLFCWCCELLRSIPGNWQENLWKEHQTKYIIVNRELGF